MKSDTQETVTIGTVSYDAMWADFAAKNTEQTPPDGSMCAEDYCAKFGGTVEAVRMMLRRRAQQGQFIESKVRVMRAGHLREIMFYTPVPSALVNHPGSIPRKSTNLVHGKPAT